MDKQLSLSVMMSRHSGVRLLLSRPRLKVYGCFDLSRFNESEMCERNILPSVDKVLTQLVGAQVLSKVDCYNAF